MINPFRYFKTSPEIIRLAVMKYVRFPFSLRQVEDLLDDGKPEVKRNILQTVIQRVELGLKLLTLTLDKLGLAEVLHVTCHDVMNPVSINVPVRLQRRGVETKLIIDGPNAGSRHLDTDLCCLIAQAHHWFEQLTSGEASTVQLVRAGRIARESSINTARNPLKTTQSGCRKCPAETFGHLWWFSLSSTVSAHQ